MKTILEGAPLTESCVGCQFRPQGGCRNLCMGPGRIKHLKQDTILWHEDESPKLTGVLRRGVLRAERSLSDGRRSIIGLFLPGDAVGKWPGADSSCAVAAATDVEICMIDPAHVRATSAKDPGLRAEILRQVMVRHLRQLELIWQRGALNSQERIMAFLVMATEFMPTEPMPDGSVLLKLGFSRRDWADLTNTTVETICRTLGDLAKTGVVRSASPGRYIIRDLAELSAMAGTDRELDFWAFDEGRMAQPYIGKTPSDRPETMAGRPIRPTQAPDLTTLSQRALSARLHRDAGTSTHAH